MVFLVADALDDVVGPVTFGLVDFGVDELVLDEDFGFVDEDEDEDVEEDDDELDEDVDELEDGDVVAADVEPLEPVEPLAATGTAAAELVSSGVAAAAFAFMAEAGGANGS